jgi:hypothetical protein
MLNISHLKPKNFHLNIYHRTNKEFVSGSMAMQTQNKWSLSKKNTGGYIFTEQVLVKMADIGLIRLDVLDSRVVRDLSDLSE